MKKILLILIIIIELFIIKIPKYVELNNLAIIETIYLEKNNQNYYLILKETIPIKSNQGISYDYKYYKSTDTTIKKAYEKIKHKTKKKLYLSKTKFLITNITNTKDILTDLNISPKHIKITTKSINSFIKKNQNQ